MYMRSIPSSLMENALTSLPTPNLDDDQFVKAVCALRPCRHNGLRIEAESIGTKAVVHNYGHGGCGITISFGTAEIAADLVNKIASKGDSIAVLGAGVIGLTTARELLQLGFQVKLYADKVGLHTTSNIAGALWLPMAIEFGDTTADYKRKVRILTHSHRAFQRIDRERYGIQTLPIYEPAASETELGIFGHLFDENLIDYPEEVQSFPFQCQAKPGQRFVTDFIQTPQFLEALIEDIHAAGGEFVIRKFESQSELQDLDEKVLVNCMALGSGKIFPDELLYPARGVLVHMKPQDLGYGIHDGFKYMFPRNNALILGGCCQHDRWDDVPDQEMIDEILNHHRRFFGQL